MIIERIKIKFDNELYSAEIPVIEGYTGSVTLACHWKGGRLLNVEVTKKAELGYPHISDLIKDQGVL